VVVSHDRYFLNRVCTAIFAFEGNARVVYSEGNYDYYLEKKARAQQPLITSRADPGKTPAKKAEKPRKLTFKEQKELEGMESAIQEAEQKVADLEALFLDPDFHRKHGQRTGEIQAELAVAKENVARSYARWEELEAIRANSGRS
jgi:ATP-binding cassette subfamily F protein uup